MSLSFAGKKILITGASSGIGRELADLLLERGAHVALVARRLEAIEAWAAPQRAARPQQVIWSAAADVTVAEQVFQVVEQATAALDGLDVAIVNAGMAGGGMLGFGHYAIHEQVIKTNVLGALATTEAVMAHFRRQNRGHVVLVSSVAAFRGLPGSAVYSASKAAVSTLAQGLRAETWGTPIKVTVLHPGYIDTPINQNLASRPFLVSARQGAAAILYRLEHGASWATVPRWPWALVPYVVRLLPTALLARLSRMA
jgi:NADP-dependent 3-hydroxy acid dehydrogenase YdfG